ncbi:MAG TPA: hypothetical protein VMU37_09855, partial [Caulobacteraceae bacterium]|nr:hypothetical protein [Caulobacteraceae bacterium]
MLFATSPALADAPIATANGAAAPAPASPPPPLPSVVSGTADQPIGIGPCGPERVKPDGSLATTPHGTVEAGIGTNGYRHLAG